MLWLALFSAPIAIAWTAVTTLIGWRVDRFARSQPRPTGAKAIVVLGARVAAPGEPSPALARRAEKAVELYRQGLAPLLVFSGGVSGALPSEASVARDLAVRLGVPASACLLEEGSHSTRQNAELTAPLLRARGIEEVVLVSDGYHLLRARLRFAEQGIRTQPVASERSLSKTDRAYWTMREALALLRTPGALLR